MNWRRGEVQRRWVESPLFDIPGFFRTDRRKS